MSLNFFSKNLLIVLIVSSLTLFYLGRKTVFRSVSSSQKSVESDKSIIPGDYFQISISDPDIERYLVSANYRIWIPEGIDKVRGIIVKQHGCGIDAARAGLDHANDFQWQALASKHQFALMGTELIPDGDICERWALANYASKNAFFQALDSFAQKSGYSELTKIPWVLWGHSSGADWVGQIFQEYPQRTITMVGLRGGGMVFAGTNPNLIDTPVLIAVGKNDNIEPDITIKQPQDLFYRHRKLGALWALAVEANTGHKTGNSRLLVIPYIDAIITSRLIENSTELRPIDQNKGWLGDNITGETKDANVLQKDSFKASWLPNRDVALKWQKDVTTGKITPTRKPHAPTNVNANKINSSEILVTWNYTPDIENGLPSFRIYRDRKLIHTLEKPQHNFHDSSRTGHISLEFLDRKANVNSTYTVSAFNQLGESISQNSKLFY